MSKLIDKIAKQLQNPTGANLKEHNFTIAQTTQAIMKKDFSSLKSLAYAYNYDHAYDDFASSITAPTTIENFISNLSNQDADLALVLNKTAIALEMDNQSTHVVELVWTANICDCIANESKNVDKLNSLFMSLQKSPEYNNTSSKDLRQGVSKFTSAIDAYYGINAEDVNKYIAIASILSPQAKDFTKWIDYRNFETIEANDNAEINSFEDAMVLLASADTSSCRSVFEYIKNTYFSTTDKKSPNYCENDLVKEYKASVMFANLALHANINDANDIVGLNILARLKHIPEMLSTSKPLSQIAGDIENYCLQANEVATQSLAPLSQQSQPTQAYVASLETYTTNQLKTFEKIAKAKLEDLTAVMTMLKKHLNRTRNVEKVEEKLNDLSCEFDVELTSVDEQPNATLRLNENIGLLLGAIDDRYNEVLRCLDIFKKVRTKEKTNLDIQNLQFDSKLLGNLAQVSGKYQENLIKGYYWLVASDPILKTKKGYLPSSPSMRLAKMKDIAQGQTLPKELHYVMQSVSLKPSQVLQYEAEKTIETDFEHTI